MKKATKSSTSSKRSKKSKPARNLFEAFLAFNIRPRLASNLYAKLRFSQKLCMFEMFVGELVNDRTRFIEATYVIFSLHDQGQF